MIEQLAATQKMQDSVLAQTTQNLGVANSQDVMRFNMELSDNSSSSVATSHLLQDVKVDPGRIDSQLLKSTFDSDNRIGDPLLKLDKSYQAILQQMNDVPEFDKFLEIHQNKKAPAVRTNVVETEPKDSAEEVKDMLSETRELYKTAGSYSKEVSRWHITAQIWSANMKILTTVVSQASQGFKTLFRSAG